MRAMEGSDSFGVELCVTNIHIPTSHQKDAYAIALFLFLLLPLMPFPKFLVFFSPLLLAFIFQYSHSYQLMLLMG